MICLNNISLILIAEGHDAGDEANKTEVQERASKPMPFFTKFWELQVCHSLQKDFSCTQKSFILVSLTICLLATSLFFFLKLAGLEWLHLLHALHVLHACTCLANARASRLHMPHECTYDSYGMQFSRILVIIFI